MMRFHCSGVMDISGQGSVRPPIPRRCEREYVRRTKAAPHVGRGRVRPTRFSDVERNSGGISAEMPSDRISAMLSCSFSMRRLERITRAAGRGERNGNTAPVTGAGAGDPCGPAGKRLPALRR